MSNAGYWKWRAQAKKRMHEFDKLHPQVHALMAKLGWEVICQATPEEDKEEKWDWAMIKHPATDDEILGLVDIKFGGVRDDHVKYFEKHGKSHGVTHYAFGYRRGKTDFVKRVRVVTVEYFMKNKVRLINSESGEPFWVLSD
jgi:hypothetical protein